MKNFVAVSKQQSKGEDMAEQALKIDQKAERWRAEINNLISSSKNKDEAIALKCFERAMRPYLDNPETLRTLLGKIKMADDIG